jgi:hypothetical protein
MGAIYFLRPGWSMTKNPAICNSSGSVSMLDDSPEPAPPLACRIRAAMRLIVLDVGSDLTPRFLDGSVELLFIRHRCKIACS